eukprot:GHVR01026299.1.p1 GENE.GHVR01026299.1~~GHVR01026299.1.p1  ORF type:complete len:108 (-),score=0.45 GHVR01026299.1:462-785(-)
MLWRTNLPIARRILNHKADVLKVSFSKNSDFAISAGEDCKVKIWKLKTGEQLRELFFENPIFNFCLSFSGTYMVICEITGKMSFLNMPKGQKINSFQVDLSKIIGKK